MLTAWFSSSRFSKTLTAVFVLSLLSACSTEEFANAVADNIVTDTASIQDTSIPDTEQAQAPAPSSGNTPEPVATTPTSTQSVAMYSYSADLSNPRPLSGAALEQTMVYMFFDDTSYSSMKFYCCKGIDGASAGESHSAVVTDSSAPFIYSVDLSQYATTGTRELYVDRTRADGTGIDNLFVNFTINVESTYVTQQPDPDTEPDTSVPETTTPSNDPVVSDVNLSWVAPSEREDNTGISLSEIAGYKIYYGTTQGKYTNSIFINDGTAGNHTINNLTGGTYYFVITTYDTEGRESQYSSVVTVPI